MGNQEDSTMLEVYSECGRQQQRGPLGNMAFLPGSLLRP